MSAAVYTPFATSVRGTVQAAARIPSDWWGPRLIAVIVVVWLASFAVTFDVSLVILTFIGFALAFLGAVNPTAGLLGAGILCTLDAMSRSFIMTGGLLRYNSLNYVLIFMMVMALPLMEKLKDTQTRLLEGFFLLLAMGVVASPDWLGGLQHLLNVVAIFGIVIYFLRTRFDPHMMRWVAYVNGVLSAFGGLVFFLQINKLPWLRPDAQDHFMNANAFSYFPLTGVFSICLAYPFVRPSDQNKLGVLALADLLWVFLSASRGSMMVGTICLIFLLTTTTGFSRRALFMTVAPVLGLTALTLFGDLQQHALQRISKLFDTSYSMSGRTSGRSDVALVGFAIFENNPLGVGTGGFPYAYANADFDETAFAGMYKQAHSGWIKTLVENGVVGAAMLFLYVTSFFVTGSRKRLPGMPAIGVLVTMTLTVAFFSAEFQAKGLWFLAAGATAVLNYPMAVPRPRAEVLVVRN
jgi:hypothetical protein